MFVPTTAGLHQRVRALMQAPNYEPLRQHELAKALGLKGTARAQLRRLLRQMERAGEVVRLRKNRWALPRSGREVVGTLWVHPQGFGFVSPDAAGEGDIYIPKKAMGTALHGDRVEVLVTTGPTRRPRRADASAAFVRREGRVRRVIERRVQHVVGHLLQSNYYWYVVPDNPRILWDVRVREFDPKLPPLSPHRKVTVRLDPWDSPLKPLCGVVIEDLGPVDAPDVDVLGLVRAHGFSTVFSPAAEAEAARHPRVPSASARDGRRDLRDAGAFTIDPWNARDFDDAVSLSRETDGTWVLGVHIADVAHYVPAGSALDREAYLRGNSVYLVDRVLPMLPAYLTREVCSLQAGCDRLTRTVSIGLSPAGEVRRFEIFRSLVRSAARLTYEQVQEFFDSGSTDGIPPPVAETLLQMRDVARILRRERMSRGSLDLNLPEVECVLNEEGRLERILRRGAREAYQLIEEFMLLANRVVAGLLADSGWPALYRVHEAPEPDQWMHMAEDLAAFGFRDAPATAEDINRIARSVAGNPREHAVHLCILRNLKRAAYAPQPGLHFGLAFSRYTHFTSPVRRYPDLVVHRILHALEEGHPPPYDRSALSRIAAHCSATEREADDAEEESVAIARIRYYEELLRAGRIGPYSAVAVSVVPKGVIVELTDTLQRGLVPHWAIEQIGYESRGRSARPSRRSKLGLGAALDVVLARVDTARRWVDLLPAELASPRWTPARRRRQRMR